MSRTRSVAAIVAWIFLFPDHSLAATAPTLDESIDRLRRDHYLMQKNQDSARRAYEEEQRRLADEMMERQRAEEERDRIESSKAERDATDAMLRRNRESEKRWKAENQRTTAGIRIWMLTFASVSPSIPVAGAVQFPTIAQCQRSLSDVLISARHKLALTFPVSETLDEHSTLTRSTTDGWIITSSKCVNIDEVRKSLPGNATDDQFLYAMGFDRRALERKAAAYINRNSN